MAEPQYIGSIGSTNTDLSKFMLDSSDVIEEMCLRLQGYELTPSPKGDKLIATQITFERGKVYPRQAVSWMRTELRRIMNKNTFLSNISEEDEMYREANSFSTNFKETLWVKWKDLDITVEQFVELCHIYDDFLSMAIRRPLRAGDKGFLKETTSETTSKIQEMTQTKKDGGLLGGLGGLFGGNRAREQ